MLGSMEIGSTLREARIRRGLDIHASERATRIRSSYLEALETEHFELIPGQVYVKSFLRTYAAFLDLDADRLVDAYVTRHEPEPERRAHTVRQLPDRKFRPRMPGGQLSWLALTGVLAVALLVWIGAGGTDKSAGPLPDPPPTPSPTLTTAAPPPAAGTLPPVEAPPSRNVVLTLSAADGTGSYVEVRRGAQDGEELWVGTLSEGASRRFADADGLWLRVGRTSGLSARVNGERVALEGGTANFLVTPSGVEPESGG